MRKRLLALALLTTLACALAPSVTFADERGATPTPVTIEVGDDGAPVSTSGDGWTYDDGELVLEAGYAFAFTGHAFDVSGENRIWNSGIIVDGIFVNGSKGNGSAVHNEAGGVIQGGHVQYARQQLRHHRRAARSTNPRTTTGRLPAARSTTT